jgi:Zn-dependent protease with chaperone function
MATKQRNRSRRPNSRDRAPQHVEPVLDPNWQNPYAPTLEERHDNQRAVRIFALRRKRPQIIVVGVVVLALVALVVVAPWLPIVAVLVAVLYFFALRRSLARFSQSGDALANAMLAIFTPGGTAKDRQRLITVLDRLSATFGVDGVSAFIVEDPDYNAALVPNGAALSLFVTSTMMSDFELIEIEGVVAHCLARHRLGLLNREAAASMMHASDQTRRALAGVGNAYRADEVAAAAIRYPQGLAEALRKCSRHAASPGSFFSSPAFADWRWIWFDVRSDQRESDMGDLDDVELRARALDEW